MERTEKTILIAPDFGHAMLIEDLGVDIKKLIALGSMPTPSTSSIRIVLSEDLKRILSVSDLGEIKSKTEYDNIMFEYSNKLLNTFAIEPLRARHDRERAEWQKQIMAEKITQYKKHAEQYRVTTPKPKGFFARLLGL
ncbi:hypothetical protein Acj9p032 [Acinetobacter phage Acj9]|uniref:Uncharacterized protein n=1 Tax=Acinetobacter phage Acj9 TaxID=760939 RepID=E5EPG6_9CAUD|nr:hypothetical protein Acj9p032 [Acinetobacter phage Acj9]ADG59932.1 hypothetical protein Acj9p032 [Acinetobacter phage Acj9]